MRYICLRCCLSLDQQDSISLLNQRLGGWMSVGYVHVDYYLPEHLGYMLYLIDPNLTRQVKLDYIV